MDSDTARPVPGHPTWRCYPDCKIEYLQGSKWKVKAARPQAPQGYYRLTYKDCRTNTVFSVSLARIILETWGGPPPSPKHVARFRSKDYSDCGIANLYWGVGPTAAASGSSEPDSGPATGSSVLTGTDTETITPRSSPEMIPQRYDDKAVCPIPPELAAPMTKLHAALGAKIKAGGASGEELAKLFRQLHRLATSVRLEEKRRLGYK